MLCHKTAVSAVGAFITTGEIDCLFYCCVSIVSKHNTFYTTNSENNINKIMHHMRCTFFMFLRISLGKKKGKTPAIQFNMQMNIEYVH